MTRWFLVFSLILWGVGPAVGCGGTEEDDDDTVGGEGEGEGEG